MHDDTSSMPPKKWYEWLMDLVRESPNTYSLSRLDHKILKHLKKRFGFFVEAGANDGIQQSNTLYFEKHRNWRGILIEADPALASQCRKVRKKLSQLRLHLLHPVIPERRCHLHPWASWGMSMDLSKQRKRLRAISVLPANAFSLYQCPFTSRALPSRKCWISAV